jgi:hypothetical protein
MKRYEYHFMPDAVGRIAGVTQEVMWCHSLMMLWLMCAFKIIDHLENEIVKNRYGRTGRIYQG